jgi:hypothetical protein
MTDEYLPPPAPAGLGDAGKALWDDAVAVMQFESHELATLGEAARTLDAVQLLQDALDADGPIVESPQGTKVNPALPELRQQRIAFARLLAVLKFPPADDSPIKARPARGVYGLQGA